MRRIIYWSVTLSFCLRMLMNACAYLTSAHAKKLCGHFGFPDFFRIEPAVARIIGVMALLLVLRWKNIRDWARSKFAVTTIPGFIAHYFSGAGLWLPFSHCLASFC